MLRLWSSGAERARRSAELRIAALLLRMHLVLLSACCHVQFCCPFSVAQGATTLSLAAFCAKTRSLAPHIVAKVNFESKYIYAQMSAVCLHFQFKCQLFISIFNLKCQLFVYISVNMSAVYLHFQLNVNCLFTFSVGISAVCLY